MMRLAALLLALCCALPAGAAPLARVTALQAPAWMERGDSRQPVTPGLALEAGDRLLTGPGGHLRLELADGSSVKLGAEARFQVNTLALSAPEPADQATALARSRWGLGESRPAPALLTAALETLRGAFRFTTGALGKLGRREVRITVGSATVGIRGTDVWGKSSEEKDLVCLIEGQVQVRHPEGTAALTEPLSFFVAPRGRPPQPVGKVERTQLETWARETEPVPGAGLHGIEGSWQVNVFSAPTREEAESLRRALAEAGFAATVSEARVKGRDYFRVRLDHLTSRQEAQGLARRLKDRFAPGEPWVSHP